MHNTTQMFDIVLCDSLSILIIQVFEQNYFLNHPSYFRLFLTS